MEDKILLSLTCATCDNPDCKKAKKWIPVDSLYGCNRWVPERVYEQYYYYMNEIIPFWHLYDQKYINQSYFEIYNFLQEIYKNYPIVNMKDIKGKVIKE